MMPVCPICGKLFVVHWPEHWVYRRGPTYYCSDQCMDVSITRDTKTLNDVLSKKRKKFIMKQGKIKDAMRQKAVEMAIRGENPLPYLKECGAKNPSACWLYIKGRLEKTDPEKFAQLPERLPRTAAEAMDYANEAADKFFAACAGMGLKGLQAETPEQPTIKLDGAITIQAKDVGAVTVETPEGEYSTPPSNKAKIAKPVNYGGYEVCCIQSKALGRFYWDCDHNRLDWTTAEGEEVSFSPAGWKKFMEEMPKIAAILGVEL